jgi:putative transposase
VLKQLDQNWRSFFAALRAWREHPRRFLGRPRPPGYKHKQKGRMLLTYNGQAFSRRWLRKVWVKPSRLDVFIRTQQTNIKQVRIVPRRDHYVVEIVYEREPEEHNLDGNLIAGVDLGIDNLITLTSNQPGFTPVVVNGRGLKSINQYDNKRRAELQAQVRNRSTKRLCRLTEKRNRQIKHLLHISSRRVIDHLVMCGTDTLVIGYNPNWKQRINIGRVNNQKFVSIPHAMLVDMLTYKAKLASIQVVLQEESYTSKCSFLDGEFPRSVCGTAGQTRSVPLCRWHPDQCGCQRGVQYHLQSIPQGDRGDRGCCSSTGEGHALTNGITYHIFRNFHVLQIPS